MKLMKLILVNCLCIFIVNQTVAQGNQPGTNQNTLSSQPEVFESIFSNQFRTITGSTTAGTAAFAELDLKDSKVVFAPTFLIGKFSVLALKASGSATDGVFAVVKDDEFNSEVSFGAAFSFVPNSNFNRYYYKLNEKNDFVTKKILTGQVYQAKIAALNNTIAQETANLLIKTNALAANPAPNGAALTLLNNQKLALEQSLNEKNLELIELIATQKKSAKLFDFKNMPITGFRMAKWNISYDASYNDFKLFDSKLSFANQVIDTTVWTQSIGVNWSLYNYANSLNFRTFYFDLSAKYSRTNNISSLDKLKMTDRSNYLDSNSSRYSSSEYVAYHGDFNRGVNRLTLQSNLYYFPISKLGSAIHISGGTIIQDDLEPTYSFGLGILAPFKKKDKEEVTLNAELYYNLYDLTNASKSDLSTYQRYELGLRFAFPINFAKKD